VRCDDSLHAEKVVEDEPAASLAAEIRRLRGLAEEGLLYLSPRHCGSQLSVRCIRRDEELCLDTKK